MKKVIMERKDIAFYIKMFPLNIHPGAKETSETIVCEKSLALLEDAYEHKPLPKAKCHTAALDETLRLVEKLGISGTPAIIFPDGRLVSGYRDAKTLIKLLGN
jgi:thiol:disulfide interchange protein DsbC